MTKEKNVKLIRTLLLAATMIMMFAVPAQAKAASSRKTLSLNKTYSEYDITNDGKKDTIYLTTSKNKTNGSSNLKIYVNGKKAYTYKDPYGYNIQNYYAELLTLSNNQSFLYLAGYGDSDDGPRLILQYDKSSGKFKEIVDFESLFSSYGKHIHSEIISVKGKKIVARMGMCSHSLGSISFEVTFTCQSGTLKRSNKLSNCQVCLQSGINNTLTTNRSISVYGSRDLTGKKYKIQKNQKVRITGFYMKGSKFMFKMKVNGKTRWKAFSKNYKSKWLFKNLKFVG